MKFDVDLFNRTYRGTRWFSDESKYFTEFLKDIQNAELMSHLRFCNDFLQTPPIFAYVRFRRDLYTGSLEKKEDIKRLLGIFERRNCPIFTLHTSGHADGDAIQKLIKAVNPKETIFVHGEV